MAPAPAYRDALERIIARFPFDEVASHMRLHRWKWYDGYPDAARMASGLRGLLASSEPYGGNSSGGFRVTLGPALVVTFQGKRRGRDRWDKRPVWTETETLQPNLAQQRRPDSPDDEGDEGQQRE